MNAPRTRSWGLKIPRPPTPSEGATQSYTRIGPPESQKQLQYKNGTSLTFGPDDLVDEFEKSHPFQEQIALMDSTIADLLPLHNSYQYIRYPNKDPHQYVWDNFRSMNVDPPVARINKLESGTYKQVPSCFASYADDDLTDARFASMSQEELEIKRLAQKARHENLRWWDDSDQAYRKTKSDDNADTKEYDGNDDDDESSEKGVETPVSSKGTPKAEGKSQEPNSAIPSIDQGSPAVSYSSHESQIAEQQQSHVPHGHNAAHRGRGFHYRGNKYHNGYYMTAKYNAQAVKRKQAFNHNGYGQHAYYLGQQAMFTGGMTTFPQHFSHHMMPAAIGSGQQFGYQGTAVFRAHPSQNPGSMVPVTTEAMHQSGYGSHPSHSSDLQTEQYTPLGIQPTQSVQGRSQQQIPKGRAQTHLSLDTTRDPVTRHESGGSSAQAQHFMRPVHANVRPGTTRDSVVAHEFGGSGTSPAQHSMRPGHANFRRDTVTSHGSDGSGTSQAQHLTKPTHAKFRPATTRDSRKSSEGNFEAQYPLKPVHASFRPHTSRDSAAIHRSASPGNAQAQQPPQHVHANSRPDAPRDSAATHTSAGPGNSQAQYPMTPVHANFRPKTTRDSAATHKPAGQGNVQVQHLMQPVHAKFRPGTTRQSAGTYISKNRRPETTDTTPEVHLSGPQPIDASLRLQHFALDESDYDELDREYDFWLDEENPLSSRYRGQRNSGTLPSRPSPQLGPEIGSLLRPQGKVDPYQEYKLLIQQRADANNRTVSQGFQGHGRDSSTEYIGYSVFGQRPGDISREPSPIVTSHLGGGRRLYESRRSTPSAEPISNFESRRSSPGPQSSAKYNNHMKNG